MTRSRFGMCTDRVVPDDTIAMYLYDRSFFPLGSGSNTKHRVLDVCMHLPSKHIGLDHQEAKRIYPISPIFLGAFVYALLFSSPETLLARAYI